MRTVLLVLLISFIVITPTLAFGQFGNADGTLSESKIVPCAGAADCNIGALVQLGQNVLNFLVGLAIIIAAVMFAYAGWLYFSDTGNAQNVQHAHKIFGHVIIGIIIVLVAWLVVDTLLKALTDRGFNDRKELQTGIPLTPRV